MRYRNKVTRVVLEPRCEAVEAALAASPEYEIVPEAEESPKGKTKGARPDR